ncbi:MAG: hypothetical protein AB7J28_03720 [Hyphomonadaceae bacterium]
MNTKRKRPFFVSRRASLQKRFYERLQAIGEPAVKDTALRYLAESAARRLAGPGRGYGEIDVALASAPRVLATVAQLDSKPVTAALLKRLAQEEKLPRMPPWL